MNMIACVDNNFAIGYKGNLLFNIPDDKRFFRNTTLNGVVIMGRKTFESLPDRKPLSNRVNIVLSHTLDKIDEAMSISGKHVSMDAPFADGDENSLLDVLVNDSSPSADKQLVLESLRQEIQEVLSYLNDRERTVIEAYFGIGQQEMTLEEIGVKYGLTRERVRQIKEKAIRRLRNNTKNKMLMSYLG